jgi:hypothetical protein
LGGVEPGEAALAKFVWDRARAMFTVKGVAVISENEMRRGRNDMKLGRMRILDLNALRADRLQCGRCCRLRFEMRS